MLPALHLAAIGIRIRFVDSIIYFCAFYDNNEANMFQIWLAAFLFHRVMVLRRLRFLDTCSPIFFQGVMSLDAQLFFNHFVRWEIITRHSCIAPFAIVFLDLFIFCPIFK